MSTITTKEIIETMLDNDGTYPGDPQVQSIWEYENLGNGQIMWAIFMDVAHNDLAHAPAIGEYRLLWSKEKGHVNQIGILENE